MIRRAGAADVDAIEASYTELLLYEQEHGTNSQWVLGVYPTRATAERAVAAGTMYILEEGGRLCASMILNSYQAPEYREVQWLYPEEDECVLVIHTLCVPPSAAGKGFGTRMVDFCNGLCPWARHGCAAPGHEYKEHACPAPVSEKRMPHSLSLIHI